MPPISSFTGQQLLDKNTVAQISGEAEILLRNNDIAGAWQGSRHLKIELSQLPVAAVAPVLPDYRKISANLKALALPLLDKDEVLNLLQNNLSYLEARYESYLLAGLTMWILGQPDAEQSALASTLKSALPKDHSLSGRLIKVLEAALARDVKVAAPAAAPAPAGPAVAVKSDDMFDEHETKELAQEAKKVGEIGGTVLPTDGARVAAGAILKLVQREQDQEAFLKRAAALITSRLRDVRTTAEIKEYLHRPWAVGGLGIDEEHVEGASNLIEQEYQKVHSAGPLVRLVAAPVPPPPPVVPVKEPLPAEAPIKVVASPSPSLDLVLDKPTPVEPVISRITRPIRTANFNNKPRLDDVLAVRPAGETALGRTVGAADEFKFMTVADFRSLGAPAAAVNEILRRAELLRQESLTSHLRALKLFRESELVADYIALGRVSLAQGKKLSQALSDVNLNPRGMTEDEFFAIASLNSKLK